MANSSILLRSALLCEKYSVETIQLSTSALNTPFRLQRGPLVYSSKAKQTTFSIPAEEGGNRPALGFQFLPLSRHHAQHISTLKLLENPTVNPF